MSSLRKKEKCFEKNTAPCHYQTAGMHARNSQAHHWFYHEQVTTKKQVIFSFPSYPNRQPDVLTTQAAQNKLTPAQHITQSAVTVGSHSD